MAVCTHACLAVCHASWHAQAAPLGHSGAQWGPEWGLWASNNGGSRSSSGSGSDRTHGVGQPCPSAIRACPCSIYTNSNSGVSTGTGTAGAQAASFVSILLQTKSIPMESLESLVLKTCNIAKQISRGLEMEIKFKDHYIRHI